MLRTFTVEDSFESSLIIIIWPSSYNLELTILSCTPTNLERLAKLVLDCMGVRLTNFKFHIILHQYFMNKTHLSLYIIIILNRKKKNNQATVTDTQQKYRYTLYTRIHIHIHSSQALIACLLLYHSPCHLSSCPHHYFPTKWQLTAELSVNSWSTSPSSNTLI